MKKYLLTVLLMTGITYVSCDRKDDSFKTEIYQEIRSVNKMALASMSITKNGKAGIFRLVYHRKTYSRILL